MLENRDVETVGKVENVDKNYGGYKDVIEEERWDGEWIPTVGLTSVWR